ncbi:MAG: TlpA family protein disulfide reductase [Pirellulales bacterium]
MRGNKTFASCQSLIPLALFYGVLLLSLSAMAIAAEPADDTGQKEARSPEVAQGPGDERFVVPDTDAAGLIEFMKKIAASDPRDGDVAAHQKNLATAILQAAKRILAGKVDDEQAIFAVRISIEAYELLGHTGDGHADKTAAEFMDSLKQDPRPAVRLVAEEIGLTGRAGTWQEMDGKAKQAFVDAVIAFVQRAPKTYGRLRFVMSLGDLFERTGDSRRVAQLYQSVAPLFADNEDPMARALGGKIAGVARRLDLVGKPIELTGTLLDGSPFDWKQYRGKVVLIDFWATWCGPCLAELPNVKAAYDAYHDQGFDVVGISLDNEASEVETFVRESKIAWPMLFSRQPGEQGWDAPMAVQYGIMGIPETMLVGRDGRVVTLGVRGAELGVAVKELLAKPAEKRSAENGDRSAGETK